MSSSPMRVWRRRWNPPPRPQLRTWPRPTSAEPGAADQICRLRLDFGYDGTGFSGWAAQPGRRTVEAVLSEALGTILRLPTTPQLTVAGRTDAGVHARGAVAHVDVPTRLWGALAGRDGREPSSVAVRRLRGVLPADIAVRRIGIVAGDFDARFSATFRRYHYRICDELAWADPVRRFDTLWHFRPLDEAAMNRACASLVGLADFAAFCRRREGASTVRTLLAFDWTRPGRDAVLVANLTADAFCHSMVRALVGAAVAVGEGRRTEGWPAAVLRAGVRDPAVRVMPAHALVLDEVGYPAAELWAERARQTRARRQLGAGQVPQNGCRPTPRGAD